jgi:S-sulfo-L-cysteine synthase (3-phospho-L-serine-dependent)
MIDCGATLTLVHGSPVPTYWPRMNRLVANTKDWREVADALRGCRVDAVLSFSHHFCPVAARAAAALGVSGLDPAALRLCADKALVRETLAGSPFTLGHRLLRAEDPVAPGAQLPFPVIAKPVGETSSSHVTSVRDQQALTLAVASIRSIRQNRKGFAQDGAVLLEELASGPEFSVETMTWDGTTSIYGVTAKLPLAAHPFVEQADSFPDSRPEVERALGAAAQSILDAVPGFTGPAHLEMRLTPSGPRLIEINARQPGGFIPDLVLQTTGRDIFMDAICGLLTVDAPKLSPSANAATWWQIYPPRAGVVGRCFVPAAAREAREVVHAALNVSRGDRVYDPVDNHGRIGDLVVSGDTVAETLELASTLAATFTVNVVDSPLNEAERKAD